MKNDQEEFQDYIQAGFEPVQTQDGSYTLKQKGLEEEMHARGGAISESVFIYYAALKKFFETCSEGDDVEVLSVGLGMGYNEILTAAAYIQSKLELKLEVISYETEEVLKGLFLKRLEFAKEHPVFWGAFEKEMLNPVDIKKALENKLDIRGSFEKESLKALKSKKRIILFDAYSNKTSESLWDEDFLKELLVKSIKGSALTTYAATGALNRALRESGFRNLKREGFLHKRQSTLAVKD
ncbi:MAG: MnmC family methyltransferase [Bdellovibrionales bacterium]